MANAVCSPTSPRSAAVASAGGCCAASAPASSASAADALAASGPDRLGLETIDQLIARCEDGEDGEWWQALVFGFVIELGYAGLTDEFPRDAVWLVDRRVQETAEVMTTGLRLETAQQAVLDELDLFYQRQTRTEFETMATKTATVKAPVRETDDELLLRALGESDARWAAMKQFGAADAEINDVLEDVFGTSPLLPLRGQRDYATSGAPHAAIWFDKKSPSVNAMPSLIGPQLLRAVRRVLGIGETNKPAGNKPRTKSPAKSETDDEVLRRSLNWHETAWERLRATGANNRQLMDEIGIRYGMGAEYGGPGTRHYRTRGGNDPAIWFDEVSSEAIDREPDLSGDKLVTRVRELLAIPHLAEVTKSSKSRVNGHVAGNGVTPAMTSTTTPAGIAAQQAAAEAAEGLVFVEEREIPVRLIDDSPYQTCDPPSDERLKEMAESFKKWGQRDAAKVRERPDGRFELMGGHTRKLTVLYLAWLKLRCRVYRCDDVVAASLVLDDNAEHRELNVIERGKALKKILETYNAAGRSMRDMADDRGVSQSSISNQIRLLDLPETIQARLLANELTQEQARKLARWGANSDVIEGFEKRRADFGPEAGTALSKDDFEQFLWEAVKDASRPMAKSTLHWDKNRLFTPTAEQRSELQVEEVTNSWGGKEERAFNTKLWDKLQREAKKEQKEKEQKAATKSSTTEKPVAKAPGEWAIRGAWADAAGRAIGQYIRGKLSKAQRSVVQRLAVLFYLEYSVGKQRRDGADLVQMTEAAFGQNCCDVLLAAFDGVDGVSFDGVEGDEVLGIAEALGLNLTEQWRPDAALLNQCPDAWLHSFAGEIAVPKAAAVALVDHLVKHWKPGYVPDQFALPKPKKGKGKK